MVKRFDYKEACKYIEDAAKLGSKPGLERIQGLCDILDDPQDDLRFIHIAGTNGKGSTACMIGSVLSKAGLRVGMYTSPAVFGIRDHYRINGEIISESDYADIVSAVAAANEKLINNTGDGATQFELETAVAFMYFSENHCDAVILECGMGGRDDATNIVKNKICCVFTSISFDHMQYLGNTLSDIAHVKLGIITSDCPVIALASCDEAAGVIKKRCDETGSRLYTVDPAVVSYTDDEDGICVDCEEYSKVRVGLAGAYQAENAALALRALTVIDKEQLIEGCAIDESAVRCGLADVKWPFRFERIGEDPLIFVDGAHNEDAALKLGKTIEDRLCGRRIILVLGMFRDKEYEKVIAILAKCAHKIFTLTVPDANRALAADIIAECAGRYCSDVTVCKSIEEAYRLSSLAAKKAGGNCAVVAAGSLSYLNEFKQCGEKIQDEYTGQGI